MLTHFRYFHSISFWTEQCCLCTALTICITLLMMVPEGMFYVWFSGAIVALVLPTILTVSGACCLFTTHNISDGLCFSKLTWIMAFSPFLFFQSPSHCRLVKGMMRCSSSFPRWVFCIHPLFYILFCLCFEFILFCCLWFLMTLAYAWNKCFLYVLEKWIRPFCQNVLTWF